MIKSVESFPESQEPSDVTRTLEYLELLKEGGLKEKEIERRIKEEIESQFGIPLNDDLRLRKEAWVEKYGPQIIQRFMESLEARKDGIDTKNIQEAMEKIGGLPWKKGESLERFFCSIVNIYLLPKGIVAIRSTEYDDIFHEGGKREEMPSPDILILITKDVKVKDVKTNGEVLIKKGTSFGIDLTLVEGEKSKEKREDEGEVGTEEESALTKEVLKRKLEKQSRKEEKYRKVRFAMVKSGGIRIRFGITVKDNEFTLNHPEKAPLKVPILCLAFLEEDFEKVRSLTRSDISLSKLNSALIKKFWRPVFEELHSQINPLIQEIEKDQHLQEYEKKAKTQRLEEIRSMIWLMQKWCLDQALEINKIA